MLSLRQARTVRGRVFRSAPLSLQDCGRPDHRQIHAYRPLQPCSRPALHDHGKRNSRPGEHGFLAKLWDRERGRRPARFRGDEKWWQPQWRIGHVGLRVPSFGAPGLLREGADPILHCQPRESTGRRSAKPRPSEQAQPRNPWQDGDPEINARIEAYGVAY